MYKRRTPNGSRAAIAVRVAVLYATNEKSPMKSVRASTPRALMASRTIAISDEVACERRDAISARLSRRTSPTPTHGGRWTTAGAIPGTSDPTSAAKAPCEHQVAASAVRASRSCPYLWRSPSVTELPPRSITHKNMLMRPTRGAPWRPAADRSAHCNAHRSAHRVSYRQLRKGDDGVNELTFHHGFPVVLDPGVRREVHWLDAHAEFRPHSHPSQEVVHSQRLL